LQYIYKANNMLNNNCSTANNYRRTRAQFRVATNIEFKLSVSQLLFATKG